MGISIEESTTDSVSPLLEEMIKRLTSPNKAPDSIQKDYLLILLIVSMIENGFVLVDDRCEILDLTTISSEQICKWKSQTGVYEVSLIMSGFKNTPLKLILSPLGAMALVNVVIKDFESETYSVCLPMSKYVVSPQATTIPKVFRDLKHFSITFKNKVLAAVKSRILVHYGYASASLIGLPEELLFKIMLKLPVSDVVNVSKSCMTLRGLLQSDCFWHDILKRDFRTTRNLPANGEYDWKEIYKSSYSVQKEKVLARQKIAGTLHDYMDYSDYVSYIDNPMWNALL